MQAPSALKKHLFSCVHLQNPTLACTKPNFVTRPPSLWRSFVVLCINKVWGVTPCGAVKSALWLSPSFWHCLCLAILFICLNLVRSSPKGSANTLVLPHGSGTISDACVFVVRITWSRYNLPQGCPPFPPLFTTYCSYCLIWLRALFSCVTFSCVSWAE